MLEGGDTRHGSSVVAGAQTMLYTVFIHSALHRFVRHTASSHRSGTEQLGTRLSYGPGISTSQSHVVQYNSTGICDRCAMYLKMMCILRSLVRSTSIYYNQ